MKKILILLTLCFMSCGFAMAKDNYGFIDLPYIMSKYSASVNYTNALKQRDAEIQKMVKEANTKIAATKDAAAKKNIEASYVKQIRAKIDAMEAYKKQNGVKIQSAINTAIDKVGKTNNYALILSGSSVVYGATNVSDLVLRELNQR